MREEEQREASSAQGACVCVWVCGSRGPAVAKDCGSKPRMKRMLAQL